MTQEPQVTGGAFPIIGPLLRTLGRTLYWIFRITWRIALVLLVLAIIGHISLSIYAGRKLEAELKLIRDSGEPLTLIEAAPPEVPDSQNAAILYQQAFGWSLEEAEESLLVEFTQARVNNTEPCPSLEEVEAIIASLEKEISLIREASYIEDCRFPINYAAGGEAVFPHLAQMRRAVRIFSAKSLFEAERGNIRQALDDFAIIIRMGNHIGQDPTLINQLVQSACINTAYFIWPQILNKTQPQTRKCQELLDALAGADPIEAFHRTMLTERTFGRWSFEVAREKGWMALTVPPVGTTYEEYNSRLYISLWPYLRFVWEPIFKLDESYYLNMMGKIIAAFEMPLEENMTAQKQLAAADRMSQEDVIAKYMIVTRIMSPVFTRAIDKRNTTIAQLRLMETSIALSDYLREQGEYPDSIDQLTSVRQEALIDPSNNQPLIYTRQDKGYLLYSVGPNLADNDGIDQQAARQRQGDDNFDIVLRVDK